jgi:hypothetical protein
MTEPAVGFGASIRKRIVVISTMERDVRVTFALGSAAVAVAVALNLFSPLGRPVMTVIGEIPAGTLIVLLLGEFLVLTLLGAGLIETKSRWRFAMHAFLGVLLGLFLFFNDFAPGAFALFIPFAMTLGFSLMRQRRQWGRQRSTQAAALIAGVTLLIACLYIAAGAQLLVVSMVAFQALVAMFGLFMASTDIAEIISVGSETLVANLKGVLGHGWILLVAALLAICANLAVTLSFSAPTARAIAQHLGSGLGLFLWIALTYGLVQLAARRLGELSPDIGYSALFLVVAAYFVALQAGVAWRVLREPQTYDPKELFTYPLVFTIPFVLLLVSVLALFMLGRRAPRTFASIVFAVWVGVLWFHYYSSQGANIVHLQTAIAWGSLLWLGLAAGSQSRRPVYGAICRLLCDLNLSFVFYFLAARFFLATHGAGHGLTIGQATLLLAALAWDILTSGEAITNRHTEAFPRFSRVCLFLAYVVTVALMVLVSVSSRLVNPLSGRAAEGIFHSEGLVGTGLLLFAPAFFLTLLTLRARALAKPAR